MVKLSLVVPPFNTITVKVTFWPMVMEPVGDSDTEVTRRSGCTISTAWVVVLIVRSLSVTVRLTSSPVEGYTHCRRNSTPKLVCCRQGHGTWLRRMLSIHQQPTCPMGR